MGHLTGWIVAGVDHAAQSQPGDDLGHLPVDTDGVDQRGDARAHAEDRLLPADTFHAQPDERLTPGEVDRRVQVKGVRQVDAAVGDVAAERVEPLGLEVADGAQRRHFGERERVRAAVLGLAVVHLASGRLLAVLLGTGFDGLGPAYERYAAAMALYGVAQGLLLFGIVLRTSGMTALPLATLAATALLLAERGAALPDCIGIVRLLSVLFTALLAIVSLLPRLAFR